MSPTPPMGASILLHEQMLRLICPLWDPLGPKVVQLTCSFGCLKNSCAIQYAYFFFLNLLPLGQHSGSESFSEKHWEGPGEDQAHLRFLRRRHWESLMSALSLSPCLDERRNGFSQWKLFRWLSASFLEFKGIYWDQGVNKLVNSVSYIKKMIILNHHKDSY